MRSIKNLPVAAKLRLLVASALVGVVLVGALGFCVQRDLRTSVEDVGRVHLPAVRGVGAAAEMVQGLRAAALHALVATGDADGAGVADARAELDALGKRFRASLASLGALPIPDATRAELVKVEPELEACVAGATRIVELASNGARADALAEWRAFQSRLVQLESTHGRLRDLLEGDAAAAMREPEQHAAFASRATWSILAAFCVASLWLGGALTGLVSRPLRETVAAVESGELTRLAALESSDEIGRIARAVHGTVERLERRTAELTAEKRALEQTSNASAESARQLAARYEEAERNARGAAAEAARFAAMVENSPACMLYVDRELIVRYVNPTAKAALSRVSTGFRTPQFVGEPLERFYRHPGGNPQFLGQRSNLPFASRFESGAQTIDLTASAICDRNGEMLGVLLTWEFVTERLVAERGMKATQARELEQAEELESRVGRLLAAVDAASNGDLTAQISIEGDDAVGRMGAGLSRLLADLRSSISRIRANAERLAGASKTLTSVSAEMNTEAAATSEQASVVSSVTTQLSENVRTVASGTEQMSNSIQEISRNTSAAASVARRAVAVAEETNAAVSRLGQSSEEIGKILKVITTIAQQTNLLALNATIEAARAGSAGKGFAVVANEVKELAKETAKATEDIRGKIDAIQTDTTGAVAAIGQIGEIIRAIDQLQTSIAGAVEQQHATTQEINGNLNDAARGSGQIVESITQMACSAHATKTGAGNSSKVSSDVSSMAGELLQLVERFKC